MADFRRWILALAMLVLVIGSVAPASAQVQQTFACTANAAVPPTIRQEGLTELVGDIVLNCVGGTPTPVGGTIPTANITVFLTNPITSRVISSPITEALLLIDEPNATQQKPCSNPQNPQVACAAPGDGGASFATNGQPNVYQGIITGPNAITFLGIPVDAPATPGAPARVYRITNIRANASTSPVNVAGVSYVQAFISASSSTSIPINNPSPIVGFIAKGLTFSEGTTGTNAFLQCQSIPQTKIASLTFTENFATAFKNRTLQPTGAQNVPGAIYNTESGLVPGPTPGSIAQLGATGQADFGTRLMATFANLPAGISLAVDSFATSSAGGTAVLIGTDPTAADPAYPGQPTGTPGITDVTTGISGGALTVVWEVTSANPVAIDSFAFGVYLTFTGAPGTPGTPTITGTTPPTVTGSFAPTSTTGTAVQIPTFAPATNAPSNIFSVTLCQTLLLFPYVTDFPGFDTGLAIANTSKDPFPAGFSAAPQTGACTVSFFGGVGTATGFTDTSANLGTSGVYSTTAANTFGTGLIAPGQTWAFEVSSIDSSLTSATFIGFTGYAIASCNFQYAHGYGFVSDYGLRNFAASYLALVIPDSPRTPTPGVCSALGVACAPTGEQLQH